jgi:Spy/CpxP family protein refolding chaperone
VAAPAQVPRAWWNNPVANGLSLSAEQKTEIATIAEEYRTRLSQQSEETDRAEAELEEVFNADTVDWRRGEQAIAQLVKARGELTNHISRMSLRMRAVLTPQQWQTLQARSRGPVRPAGRGPGVGRGPGRPPTKPASGAVSGPGN